MTKVADSGPAVTNNEPDLIAMARRGDALAWTRLIHAFEQPVYRLALLKLGNSEEARDVAQETFLAAFRNMKRFDASRSFKAWVLRITARIASNRRRGLGRYRHMKLRWQAQPSDSRAWAIELPDHQRILWSAVHELPRKAQDVIWLRYFLDLSERETAQALQIATGTVKSRTSRALVRLGEIVRQDYPELISDRKANE